MKEYVKRLTEEHYELETKIDKLKNFIGSDVYLMLSEEEQGLLDNQLGAMEVYLKILSKRLTVAYSGML